MVLEVPPMRTFVDIVTVDVGHIDDENDVVKRAPDGASQYIVLLPRASTISRPPTFIPQLKRAKVGPVFQTKNTV
jgi:hypothetical protein